MMTCKAPADQQVVPEVDPYAVTSVSKSERGPFCVYFWTKCLDHEHLKSFIQHVVLPKSIGTFQLVHVANLSKSQTLLPGFTSQLETNKTRTKAPPSCLKVGGGDILQPHNPS